MTGGVALVAEQVDELDRLMTSGVHDWDRLASHATTIARRIARKTVKKYHWLSADDLQQDLLVRLQKWVTQYNPHHASDTTWSKYLYHKMSFYVLDILRKEDPLGIKWPQRKHYPEWSRLGDMDQTVLEAMEDESDFQDFDSPDRVFLREKLAVDQLFHNNKLAGQFRPDEHAETGPGLLRAKTLEFWDRRRNRVRFRRGTSLKKWLRKKRSTRKVDSMENQVVDSVDAIERELALAGRLGLTCYAIVERAGISRGAAQAGLARLRASGEVFVIGQKRGNKGHARDLYALSQFWPDGPPVLETKRKPKPKAKPKASAGHTETKAPAKKAAAVGSGDLIILCETLAGLNDAKMKSAVLDLIRKACGNA